MFLGGFDGNIKKSVSLVSLVRLGALEATALYYTLKFKMQVGDTRLVLNLLTGREA